MTLKHINTILKRYEPEQFDLSAIMTSPNLNLQPKELSHFESLARDSPPTDSTDLESNLKASFRVPALPQAAIPKEKWRDIDILGLFTFHRLSVLLWLGGLTSGLYFAQEWIWPQPEKIDTTSEKVFESFAFLWLGAFIPAVFLFLGLIWYRHDVHLDNAPRLPSEIVVWRIVSRGVNEDALMKTIRRCQDEMKRTPLFQYVVEVVVDDGTFLPPEDGDVISIRVPKEYETKNKTLFKARALQYAVENSIVPDNAWLVHLDEETQPTSSVIKGIAKMIHECKVSQKFNIIGQGAILYHRDWARHPFLTLADNLRTGIDFGTFYFQHRVGITIFGLHGSFIVCLNSYEKSVGFDFGPNGSITGNHRNSIMKREISRASKKWSNFAIFYMR